MSIDSIKEKLPDFARDAKINIGTVLDPERVEVLSSEQIAAVALGCAYSTKNPDLISLLEAEYAEIDSNFKLAAKSATSVMAMNNVYYKFLSLVNDPEFKSMPAGLRMQALGNPPIDKPSFELVCLAISAINGCGMCVESHTKVLLDSGMTKNAIQAAVKIASVINAASTSLSYS